ncbi:MAG TPA: DUF1287 domain-containing protein, partial [Hyphomicrobiaceae bacterium]|nr:DUF1287 domain-containing protein [Hyphomicrobiaceae bacterium]
MGAETTIASIDIGRLPDVLRGEVPVAAIDVGLLPQPAPAEVAIGGLDLGQLPPPLGEEVATATVDVGALPPPLPPEIATAALDASGFPTPDTPASADRRAQPHDLILRHLPGFLMGPRPKHWPNHLPPLAKAPLPSAETPPVDLAAAAPIDAPPVPTVRPPTSDAPRVDAPRVAVPADATLERCEPSPLVLSHLTGMKSGHARPAPSDGATFGMALAAAAVAETREFGIYDARYVRISYPLGDVPRLYGACTDLVIRAYRGVGVDLQRLVHESRAGSGDRSIDHRR